MLFIMLIKLCFVKNSPPPPDAERETAFPVFIKRRFVHTETAQTVCVKRRGLQSLRAEGLVLPVLILTARDALSERIAGLDEGADDYVVKPAPLEEIAARLRALVRRGEGRARSFIDLGRLRLDTAGHAVWFDGAPVELSAMEYRLLERLARNPGRVFTKIQLEQALYEAEEAPDSNVLQVLIHHLRRKIDPTIIDTIRGLGYRLGPAAQGAAP